MIGRVYKLTCTKDETYYIGSTLRSLEERFEMHKNIEQTPTRTSKLYKHYDAIGWENVSMTLVKKVFVQNQQELYIYENQYILKNKNDPNSLNMKTSFDSYHLWLTKKEFMEFPGELVCYLNEQYNISKMNNEPRCDKPSIFRRPRYKGGKKCKDAIKRQIENKKRVHEQLSYVFEMLKKPKTKPETEKKTEKKMKTEAPRKESPPPPSTFEKQNILEFLSGLEGSVK